MRSTHKGSFEVASADQGVAEALRQADSLVPPTPTYTPFPTPTPLPTSTPQPTSTPLPTPTPEIIVQAFSDVAAAAPVEAFAAAPVEEVAAAEAPAEEAVVAAAAAPPRNLDGRLGQLGINIQDADGRAGPAILAPDRSALGR